MRNAKRFAKVVTLACVLTISFCSAGAASSEPNAAELVRAVRKSEMWMYDFNSLYVRAEGRWTTTPEAIAKRRREIIDRRGINDPNEKQFPGLRKTSRDVLEYAVDRKRVRYLTDDPGYWRQLEIWDGNELRIHEKYYHHPQEQYILDKKIQERTFQELFACNYGWPRSQPHSFWWYQQDVNAIMDIYGRAEDFKLVGEQTYRDIPCYVLEHDNVSYGNPTGLVVRWFVGRSGHLLHGIQMLRRGRLSVEHWTLNYREVVPGGWFPMKTGWSLYYTDETGRTYLKSTRDLYVIEFAVNEPLSDDLFVLPIEPGVEVADYRSGQPQIYKLWPSLLGKQLPSFEGIKLGAAIPSKQKSVLVCFVDLEQRPSRHVVGELIAQSGLWKSKSIELIMIQSSNMSLGTLNELQEKLKIPFRIGTMTGDPDALRWSWAVKFLPWLILTDKEHIVQAEGFALSELDAKIEEIVPSANDAVNTSKVTGLVKDPQGQVLSGVQVTEFQTDKEYTTDSGGKFVSAYGPSDKRRFFFAVHKQRKLVGVGQLPAGERHVEINLISAKIVSGTAINPDGKPVTRAQVAPLPMTNLNVLTDNQGKFVVGWDPEWAGNLTEFFLMARHLERNLAGGIEINEDTKTVRIKLVPALKLTGTVEDPNGVPIPGAKVGLSLRRGWACGTPVKEVVTDDKGRYEFPVLPQKQEYINFANAEGYWQNGIKTGIINNITDREEVGPIILKKPILSVSGIVVDSTGKPVTKCRVGMRGKGQPQRTTETDAQGKFTLEKICSGQIEIWAKLGSVLYGTIQAQAGQKDVKLVVSPIIPDI